MSKRLLAVLLLLFLLLAPLPVTLASKLDLPSVSNFRFTAYNTLAWDAPPTSATQLGGGIKRYALTLYYLIRKNGNRNVNYLGGARPGGSDTSATVSYDTSGGTFVCARAQIRIVASDRFYNHPGPSSFTIWGDCDYSNNQLVPRQAKVDTPPPAGTGSPDADSDADSDASGDFQSYSVSYPAPRKAAAPRPGIRAGMMLPTDKRLNAHAAAPVVAYAGTDNKLNFWHALSDSRGVAIGSVPDIKALTVAGHAGGELLRATHPESGKTVTVTYRPGFQMIEVSTFYADTAHQANKLYTFCIMDNNHVEVVFW